MTTREKVLAGIEQFQSPYRKDIYQIVGSCMASGKIDDMLDGLSAVRDGTDYDDRKLATDFVVTLGGLRVGFRMRQARYFINYRHEFTMRANPRLDLRDDIDQGVVDYNAEFEKLLVGTFPHVNIYGFLGTKTETSDENPPVRHWLAYRPDVVRAAIREEYLCYGRLPYWVAQPRHNGDQTYFRAIRFHADGFPASAIVAHSGYLDERKRRQEEFFERYSVTCIDWS